MNEIHLLRLPLGARHVRLRHPETLQVFDVPLQKRRPDEAPGERCGPTLQVNAPSSSATWEIEVSRNGVEWCTLTHTALEALDRTREK